MEATKIARENREEYGLKPLIRAVALKGVYFLLGALISRGAVLGELSPFGPAFVAAVPKGATAVSAAGCVLGYILLSPADSFRYIAVVLAIAALKWLLSDFAKIAGSRVFAPLIAFVPMVATGVALMFVSTSRMTEFGVCLVEALISSAAAYFIHRSAQLMSSSRGLASFTQQEVACLAVSLCILMLSFASVSIIGISIGRLIAVIVVLMCARYGGVAGGSVSGIATGVVFSLGSAEMAFITGGYAFGGLVGGIFSTVGRLPVGAAFTICNTVLSFASSNNRLVLSLLIESLLGTGVFMIIPSDLGNSVRAAFSPSSDRDKSEAVRRSVTSRLDHAAYALQGVTDCVAKVSEKLERMCSEDSDVEMYESAVKTTCSGCGLRAYCWDKQSALTRDDFSKLTEILRSVGYVSEKDISENFVKKCCKQRELSDSINRSYREYLSTLEAQRRITSVRSAVAGQFSGLSDMLWDLSAEFESCDNFDTDTAELITDALQNMGAVVVDCCCRVDKGKGMTVELELGRDRKGELDVQEVQRIVARCCGRRFEKAAESLAADRQRLTMCEISDYDVEIGSSSHIAENGNLCGDCIDYFLNGMGSMVAVISDGMGSGGAAAVDSNMAVSVLTKLIKAGLSYDCALTVVNSALMVKSEEESMATLDVADINLFTGKVSLLKAGAPVTFVRKAGRVHRREFPSLPVGILNDIHFAKDMITLHEGDVLLMVSDGVLTGEDKWLEDMVRSWHEASAQDFASLVVNEAIKRRKDTHDDDITAIAIRMVENG